MHPVAGSHESRVQASPSSQLMGVCVQPLAGSHELTVHALLSSQLIGVAEHTPAVHVVTLQRSEEPGQSATVMQ